MNDRDSFADLAASKTALAVDEEVTFLTELSQETLIDFVTHYSLVKISSFQQDLYLRWGRHSQEWQTIEVESQGASSR